MKLRLQNIGQATIVLKDFEGYSTWVAEVAKNTTLDTEVTEDLLQRIAGKLRELEASPVKDVVGNVLIGLRWSVIADGADDRAQTEGLAGLPNIIELQAAAYDNSSGLTDAIATGTALLGNQVKATAQVFRGVKRLDIAAVLPGAPSNSYSVAIGTPAGSSGVQVTISGSTVIAAPELAGSTVADIAAAINAHATAKFMVKATVGVAGTVTAAAAAVPLTGGIGPGVSLTLGGTACSVLSIVPGTPDAMTFDAPTGISAASRIVPLDYRNGPHLSRLSVPVVA